MAESLQNKVNCLFKESRLCHQSLANRWETRAQRKPFQTHLGPLANLQFEKVHHRAPPQMNGMAPQELDQPSSLTVLCRNGIQALGVRSNLHSPSGPKANWPHGDKPNHLDFILTLFQISHVAPSPSKDNHHSNVLCTRSTEPSPCRMTTRVRVRQTLQWNGGSNEVTSELSNCHSLM